MTLSLDTPHVSSCRRMADDPEGPGDGADRRHMARSAARIRVRFRSVEDLVTRYTTDVSRGGIFVTTTEHLPLGTLVDLALEVPDGDAPAIIPARVAYVLAPESARAVGRAPGMGMQFAEEDTSAIGARIAAYVAHAMSEERAPDLRAPAHVLVVEDSATIRNEIASALRAAGHRVTLAEHGLAALGTALREPPDLVLSDVQMPMMDGWQLLRVLRARPATREVPVVFLTTLDAERDRLRGYELGVADFIGKPFEGPALAARVQRVIERARSEVGTDASSAALRGDLAQVSLASLLSFAEAERRSGVLVLRGGIGEVSIHLSMGLVTRVDLPGAAPASLFDRLLRALDVTEGRFSMNQGGADESANGVLIQRALLEHARRADEASR